MQQFDLQSSFYGSRNSLINVEARSIETKMLTRRCVVAQLMEVSIEKIRDMLTQNAAGLIIIIPKNLNQMHPDVKQHLLTLETELLKEDVAIPIYFIINSPKVDKIYRDIKNSLSTDQSASATEALVNAASANGYQIVVGNSNAKAMNDFQIANIQGKLSGNGVEEQLPTIVMVAHYDATGVAPSLAFGADSNGSGVIALLEMARIFSKLFSSPRTHPKINIQFLLSGAGKFNFQGTKRWIEEQLEGGENSLLQDAALVICVDSISNNDSLNFHVSKPPKEGSTGFAFSKLLESVGKSNDWRVNVVHKKINLADEFLAWEHERFSIRRLPALTISSYSNHRSPVKNSISDIQENIDTKILTTNIRLIAEIVSRFAYGFSSENNTDIIKDSLNVDEETVLSWLKFLSGEPRAAQILSHKHHVVNTLHQTFVKYLKDVKKSLIKADKRDPEWIFYDGQEYSMNVYNIKPAVFDLFLAISIAAYLGTMYLALTKFGMALNFVKMFHSSPKKLKSM